MKSFFSRFTGCLLIALLLLTLTAAALAEGAVFSGVAYMDQDEDGEYSAGDTVYSGVPVGLQSFRDDAWTQCANTVTDENGCYLFSDVAPGEYRVVSLLSGSDYCEAAIGAFSYWEDGFVRGDALTVTGDEEYTDQDIRMAMTGTLSVFVFEDADMNLTQGKYEKALKGAVVEALVDGGTAASVTLDKTGTAEMKLPAGEFELKLTAPDSYGVVFLGEDTSFAAMVTSASAELSLEAGERVSLTAACRQVSSMSGTAFEDTNNNGIWDEGETGIMGVKVHVEGQKTGAVLDTETDENGWYIFLLPGKDTYTISAELPGGMLYARYSKDGGNMRSIFTRTNLTRDYVVKNGASLTNLNIGAIQKGVISGYAFLDLNYNGKRDEGEPGYKGVTVEAIKVSSGDSFGKTTTDSEGYFILENLRGGDYTLRAVLPNDGSIFSAVGKGTVSEVNLFAQRGERRENTVTPITIVSGSEVNALIGVAQGASITGYVFQDADYSGVMNGKEKAISGIRVRAVDEKGNVVAEDTSGKSGLYKLEGIMPGTYRVEFQRKAGFGFTRCRDQENKGSWVTTIEDGWGVCRTVTLAMGEQISGVYAGMLPSATVSGKLYHDANDNGTRERSENGLAGAKVRLWSEDAEMDFTEPVAADGSFKFAGVMPGTYNLEYVLPEHAVMSGTKQVTEKILTVAMGQDYTLKDALAVELGSYEGTAVNTADGSPVSGAKVTLKPSGNSKAETVKAVSGEDGSFSVTGLRPAEYTITVSLPDGLIFAEASDSDGLSWPTASKQEQPVTWAALTSRTEKTVACVQPASISGQVWMDENKNGVHDAGEWIMDGLEVSLLNEAGAEAARITTDAQGYSFSALRPGTYSVSFSLPEQASPAEDSATAFTRSRESMVLTGLAVTPGQSESGLDVGLVSTTSMGGTVRVDNNGKRAKVKGAKVELLENGSVIASQTTGKDGQYQFDGLWPDDYILRVTLPDGAIFIRSTDANYKPGDTVIYGDTSATSQSEPIALLMAQHQLELDVLCIKPATLGDLAWLDENANGVIDGDEARIPGVTVRLMQNGETIYETVTDAFGYYLFNDVYPGEYILQAEAYSALTPTKQIPSLQLISSCLASGTGTDARTAPFSVGSGSRNLNMDLGFALLQGEKVPAEITAQKPAKDWTLVNAVQTGSLGDPSVLKKLGK